MFTRLAKFVELST